MWQYPAPTTVFRNVRSVKKEKKTEDNSYLFRMERGISNQTTPRRDAKKGKRKKRLTLGIEREGKDRKAVAYEGGKKGKGRRDQAARRVQVWRMTNI